jgi:heat shock protein HslJ
LPHAPWLVACLVLASAVPAAAKDATAAGRPDLTGKIWALTSLAGSEPVRGTNPTIEFAGGHVTGSTGCNAYGATYKARLRSLSIEEPVSTGLKACPAPVSAQEMAFLSMLHSVKRYGVRKTTLTLRGRAGKKLATFESVSQDLAGTSWTVLAYNNGKQAVTSVLAGTHLTASFSKDGHVSGDGGCNAYSATYKTSTPTITVGPVASTHKNCGTPDGVMSQETAYLSALHSAASYATDGSRLELKTGGGATAVELERK